MLDGFIETHLASMLAAEELGGPVVGDLMDIDDVPMDVDTVDEEDDMDVDTVDDEDDMDVDTVDDDEDMDVHDPEDSECDSECD